MVAADGTIYIGTDDGDVRKSTDDGKTWSRIGADDDMGNGNNVLVAMASNGDLYAASAAGVYRYSTAWKQIDATASAGVGISSDGILYNASSTAGVGVNRSTYPAGSSAAVRNFQALATDLAAGDVLNSLQVVSGSTNVLYCRATLAADTGSYGYTDRVMTYSDLLTAKVELSSPADKAVTSSAGSVTLSWKAVDAKGTETYRVVVATDSAYANTVDLDPNSANTYANTDGTSYTVTGLTAGTVYYWKIKIDDVDNVNIDSNYSATRTFTPALAAPTLKSPEYGADDAIKYPTFSWLAVGGATSYELEVADNAFFANSEVKKPLTHTTWTWDDELEASTTYYWRVRAVASGNTSDWSEAVFTVAAPAAAAPPPVIVQQPAQLPDIVLNPPPPVIAPAQPIVFPAPAPSPITPAVLWAIIIIGAVLFIAVIVLIVRTRRVS
jgi:hypothetical protein